MGIGARVSALVLTGYDEVRAAYRSKDLAQALYDEGGVIMADCLLTLHGETHRRRRRLENRLFRRETFVWFEQVVMPGVIRSTLAPFIEARRADLIDVGYQITMNLTADIAGIDRPATTTTETRALLAFVKIFSAGATVVHSTRDKADVRAEVAEALERFDAQFLGPSIQRRRDLMAHGATLPRDVLSTLMLNEDHLELGHDVICREIAFYLQAGAHSTANAFTHTLDDLWHWERPRSAGTGFLQRCVHESIRLHPASPVAWRRATGAVRLRDGLTIEPGSLVIMELDHANRDRSVWGADAEQYNPLRTIPDGVPPWGHSFGGGMHACIGAELDGGEASFDVSGGTHLFGTVALMAQAVLNAGGRPDPEHAPERDPHSERNHFGCYPVVFGD